MDLLEEVDLKWKCIEEKSNGNCWRTITTSRENAGTLICSDETEDSLISLFKMVSETDMRTFMEQQGTVVTEQRKLNSYQLAIRCFLEILKMNNVRLTQNMQNCDNEEQTASVSSEKNEFEVVKVENQADNEVDEIPNHPIDFIKQQTSCFVTPPSTSFSPPQLDSQNILSDDMHITNELIQKYNLNSLISKVNEKKRPRPQSITSTEKQTRSRTHYNFKQIAVLEEIFAKHLFCPQAERKKVAKVLGLTELNVKHWFKNRRAKFRRTVGWETRCHSMNDEESAPDFVDHVLRNHYPEHFHPSQASVVAAAAVVQSRLNGLSSLINQVKKTNEALRDGSLGQLHFQSP